MSRDVCGICWCPYDDGKCGCPAPEPTALRLADELTTLTGTQKAKRTTAKQAADELRRLYEHNLSLRSTICSLEKTDTNLLWQALEMLEDNHHYVADNEKHVYVMTHLAVIEAIRARLSAGDNPSPTANLTRGS